MKRTLHRLILTLTFTSGLLTAAGTTANAGLMINHSEPVARDHQ
jgi:hypothetical protein